MHDVEFGRIGVRVKNYTPDEIYKLFVENGLDSFLNISNLFARDNPYTEGSYLQSDFGGPINKSISLYTFSGYIKYTTDMETYFLILRTALLDMDAANALVIALYHEGLIKPRNNYETD